MLITGHCKSKNTMISIPAAVFKIVFHSVVVHSVKWAAVSKQRFLDAVDVHADYQAHLGFEICRRKQQTWHTAASFTTNMSLNRTKYK